MKRFSYIRECTILLMSVITIVILIFPDKLQSQTQQWKIYNTSNSRLPNNYVCFPVIDSKGNLWISTNNYYIGSTAGGLAKFDGDTTWTIYNTSNSGLRSNNLFNIVFDDLGNKWIGTWSYGLAKFNDTTWQVYNTKNSGLPNNNVYDIAIDSKGNKWIGTDGGLACFDGDKSWKVYNTSNSRLPHNSIFNLEFDSKGNLWIATDVITCNVNAGGLAKFDCDTTWTIYNKKNSKLPSNDVCGIAFDKQGNLWVGTGDDLITNEGGLAKFDCDTTWTVYNPTNSPLPFHQIRLLTFDKQGTLWMSLMSIHTGAGGLASFDGKEWKIYTYTNSEMPCANGILGIAIDDLGNKWLGTGGEGLAVFNENSIISRVGHTNIMCTSKKCFINTSKDSLNIMTKLINTDHHNFSANAIYSNNDSKIIDSTILYDDGFHGDLAANDDNWGTYIQSISEKNYFNVGISVLDKQTGEYSKRYDWTKFTTIGPVTLDSLSIKKASNLYKANPYIHNQDNTLSIKNVSIKLICNDPWITSIYPHSITLPDITPGSTVSTSTLFTIKYSGSQFPGYFNFIVEILKDGWPYWVDSTKTVVTAIEKEDLKPLTFKLGQNYPNPFNPITKIKYVIPSVGTQRAVSVQLKVYDVLGNEVATLVNEVKPAGSYEVEFNASKFSSGIYFYQLKAGKYTEIKKMILLR